MMNNRAWARASLRRAAGSNLRFWSAQLGAGKAAEREAGNVYAAIEFGQRLAASKLPAARLLQAALGLALADRQGGPEWLAAYAAALGSRRLPAQIGCRLLWQQAVLLWQAGDIAAARAAFERSERRSAKAGLNSLAVAAAIGQCLCSLAWGDAPNARRAARRLKARLASNHSRALKAQMQAAIGMGAFFDQRYEEASSSFTQALNLTSAAKHAARAQLHIASGLCAQATQDADAALKSYNRAAAELQRGQPAASGLARLELLRAAAHYAKSSRGQRVRLQPAIAALRRAAELLSSAASDAAARRLLESYTGKVYTRAGDVARGIEYLTSALEQAEGAGDQRLVADLFEALGELANKNPPEAGFDFR